MKLKICVLLIAAYMAVLPFTSDAREKMSRISLHGGNIPSGQTYVTAETLSELKQTEYSTENPFDHQTYTYTGVLLRDLAEFYAGKECRSIILTAQDSYSVTFTKEEWTKWDIMLALKTNGNYMTLIESGPAKIVMPYSKSRTINETIYTPKWIWLIKKIEFK
jgi:hypothetical protein